MKIYVSPHYRTAMWGSVASAILIDLIILYYIVQNLRSALQMFNEEPWVFLIVIVNFWVVILCLFAMIWRSLVHTKVEEDSYQSYLGRRKQCYVDRTKDIYYTVFGYPLRKDTYGKNAYIAFSNEPFTANSSLTIFNGYDTKKVIVVPYYEETLPYLDVEKWHKIEMEYPESMKKMEKWFK